MRSPNAPRWRRRRLPRVPAAARVVLLLCCAVPAAHAACTGNRIQCENLNPGTAIWQVNATSVYDVRTLTGFASATSVAAGGSISFFVRAPGPYQIQIIRLGYYQGLGGRLLDTVSLSTGQQQPDCRWLMAGTASEYYSCDNWVSPVVYNVNRAWVSGVYVALLTAASGGHTYQYHVPFVVRSDTLATDFIYQEPIATDQAYNRFFDGAFSRPSPSFPLSTNATSLYATGTIANYAVSSASVIYKDTFDRPYVRFDGMQLYRFELPFISWLEKQGYDVSYTTDIDMHESREVLSRYKALLISGHSEYWSKTMYDRLLQARNSGVSLGFFSGNNIYWQARFEPNVAGVADRVMVVYRRPNPLYAQPGSLQPPAEAADPSTDPTQQTIYWRDPPLLRDEQTLLGVHKSNPFNGPAPILGWITFATGSLVINAPQALTVKNHLHWVYSGTGLAEGSSIGGIYGQESDTFETAPNKPAPGQPFAFLDPPYQPPGARLGTFTILGDSTFVVPGYTIHPHVNTTIYQACSGAWVFAAGSIMWANALAPSLPIGGSASPTSAAPLISRDYSNSSAQRMSANILNVFNHSAAAPKSGPCIVDFAGSGD